MNYVNEQNMQEILDGIARKIGQGGGSGAGLEDWQASHEYAENDICVYNGQIYKAIVGFESDTTFSTTQILESYTLQSGETPIAYTKGTDIVVDDIVSYDSNYYKALYDFTCGDTFGLYAFEQYTPKELTTAQEQQIVQHWQEYLGTGSGSSESSPTHYSTTEKMVGTWIDGKPLYQITYSGIVPTGADSASTDVFVDADVIGNADTIFISGGYIKWLGGGNPNDATVVLLNESNNDTTSIRTWIALGRSSVRIRCISAYISCPIVVTLQYTKTTD